MAYGRDWGGEINSGAPGSASTAELRVEDQRK